MSARIRCIATGKRQLKPVMPMRFARATSATIASASSRDVASGFSQRTCAPAAAAACAIGRCRCGGVAITTIAGRSEAIICSQSG